jgi:hypothetical protein
MDHDLAWCTAGIRHAVRIQLAEMLNDAWHFASTRASLLSLQP